MNTRVLRQYRKAVAAGIGTVTAMGTALLTVPNLPTQYQHRTLIVLGVCTVVGIPFGVAKAPANEPPAPGLSASEQLAANAKPFDQGSQT